MVTIQWVIAAGTAIFVALVGYFQWRTAQQKAVLDLYDRRYAVYEVVRSAVGIMASSSTRFGPTEEGKFIEAMERALFFFGDDVVTYLKTLWEDILDVRTADSELPSVQDPDERRKIIEKRRAALERITGFYKTGQPKFAKYMRFSQSVPTSWRTFAL